MNSKFLFILFFPLLLLHYSSQAQSKIDSVYGLNPLLYNGQIYSYAIPPSVKGNQYLTDKNFTSGTIKINDKTFTNLQLNYDIYNQEVLLQFELNYKMQVIKLCKEKIKEFTLGHKKFQLMKEQESTDKKIYQVFGEGKYKVLYHWKKELKLSNTSANTYYLFTKPQKTMYLQFNNQKHKFRNNRTFLSLFNKSNKNKIKKTIKQNGLNIKNISDIDLIFLINFCNTL